MCLDPLILPPFVWTCMCPRLTEKAAQLQPSIFFCLIGHTRPLGYPKCPLEGMPWSPSGGCRKDGEPPSGSKSLVLQSEGTPCRPTEGTSVLPLEGCRVFTPPEGRHHLPSLQREHTCAVCTRGTPCSGCAAVNSPNISSVVYIFAVRG